MKRLTIIVATACFCTGVKAQTDTAIKPKPDTIRIGNILIIKKAGKNKDTGDKDTSDTKIVMGRYSNGNQSRVTTNWWIFDLGFANYNDQTDYSNTGSYLINNPAQGVPAISASDFKLKTGKSVNVNIWVFMQKINLIKTNVNLKYGLGVELNNYRYKSGLTYQEKGTIPFTNGQVTNAPFIFRQDSIGFKKNKLAVDYLTVPLMLNFASTRTNDKKGIALSAGVSIGYLYSSRNKQKSDAFGEKKNKGEYDLEKFKFSYITELSLGPVRLYGSYSPKSMYERGLDIRPYTFGFRFSNL